MSGQHRLAPTSPIGVSWASWVQSLAVPSAGDSSLIHQIEDGRPVGTWPEDAAQRVYLTLDDSGEPRYVGQTRSTLIGRLAGHRRSKTSRTWAWLLNVTLPTASALQLDAVETSARRYFLPGSLLLGRRHPVTRVRA